MSKLTSLKPIAVSSPLSSLPVSLECQAFVGRVKASLMEEFRGSERVVELSMAAFLGRGHLLLEGPPGTGKTSLAKAIARAFGGSFKRIQMTSDLLPSDVVGLIRLKPGSHEFEFREGPIFSNILLADELNRTSPRTQSALLESMAEATVTVDGKSYALPDPFFVVATQNPLEYHGVYPLAESQLDRFMLHLMVSSPAKADELGIYQKNLLRPHSERSSETATEDGNVLTPEQTREVLREVQQVHIEPFVIEYATDLVRATRSAPQVVSGVSVRGGLQFLNATRALAYLRGQDFVTSREVTDLAVPALSHRLCFSGGEPDAQSREAVIQSLLDRIKPPK